MSKQLVNHVPELLVQKGWSIQTFVGHCMINGLSERTAYRLAQGETNFNMKTVSIVASVLGVSLESVMNMNNGGQ